MREFYDGILAVILSTSLTDLEAATITAEIPIYDQSTYNDLARILAGRESVSLMQKRLQSYYFANGFEVVPAVTGKSNILLGEVL